MEEEKKNHVLAICPTCKEGQIDFSHVLELVLPWL